MYASCSGNKQAVQLLGRNSYFSLFASPPCLISQRQRLACPAPEMTLRQISQLIRVLRQLRLRDANEAQLPHTPSRSRSASVSTGSQQSQGWANPCLHCFQRRHGCSPPCVS
ncbi:unnamed protein product [Lepidochelys olivacea]